MNIRLKPQFDSGESRDEKRALLLRLLKEREERAADGPLSSSQQRLFFLHQMNPESPVYTLSSLYRFRGPLMVEALQRAFNEVLRRHEILRTQFGEKDGRPFQRTVPVEEALVPLPVVDLSGLPVEKRQVELKRRADAMVRWPFDLARVPLLRLTLFRLDEGDHQLLLMIHHIVFDDWSERLLVQEVAQLYDAFVNHRPSPLPELPIQYSDYVAWQQRFLQGDALEAQLSYWRNRMAGAPRLLELQTDFPRPAIQRFRGKTKYFVFPDALAGELERLAQEHDATLFMIMLAAYAALLARQSSQEDLVIGVPMAGRTRSETEKLIGLFVNTVVIRLRLAGEMSFRDVLREVRKASIDAFANQDLPFERLVEELQPERSLSYSPVFQVMFDLKYGCSAAGNAPSPRRGGEEAAPSPQEIEFGTAKFDLTLAILFDAGRLAASLEYNADLFKDETIIYIIDRFRTLLESIVADPERPFRDLSILSAAEWNKLRGYWGGGKAHPSDSICIHQLFEAQAARTPHAIAAQSLSDRITYDSLNRKANLLARSLRPLGVGLEVIVGVSVDRSIEMLIALLGILKAGGAYLPLDPSYPAERLSFMLKDANAKVLIRTRGPRGHLNDSGVTVVRLDADWEQIARQSDQNLSSGASPENLAYIIYTTGSTGAPKGTLIEHRSLVNYTEFAGEYYRITPKDRILQFASLNFDASAEEIYPTLIRGASLMLRSDSMIESPATFLKNCEEQGITVLNLPTAYWHELAAALETDALRLPSSIRLVIIGGEKALSEKLNSWRRGGSSQARLVNTYGPTEATIVATNFEIETQPASDPMEKIPIGRPVRNLRAYLLDQRLRSVPVGLPGEIFLGGRGLARGYLDRPELSAEKFISDPFSDELGARMYRTGDLARYLPDGNLEFLGRTDHQVKLRGHRIELGEIESALRTHSLVSDALAILQEETPGVKRLIAYASLQSGAEATPTQLREHLRAKLPAHMIPSVFVPMQKFPLTTNGKIDRQALPKPEIVRSAFIGSYAPPQSPFERTLAGIWAETLRVEMVGVTDNFFELGGDSILSLQVAAKANHAGIHLTPRQIFQYQTIGELAAASIVEPEIEAEQGAVEGDAPLTPIQLWFFERELPEPERFNQSITLELEDSVEANTLERLWRGLLDHHDALRMRYGLMAGRWKQWNAGKEPPERLYRFDLSALDGGLQRPAAVRALSQLHGSLHLEQGPIARAGLLDFGPGKKRRLILLAHHLATDAVSWRILLEDFQLGYERLSRGQSLEFLPKTTSYKEWGERLLEYSKSEALIQQREHWLAEERKSLRRLPVDFPGSDEKNTTASALELSRSLEVGETEHLLRDVPAVFQSQINDVLLTALAWACARWTGDRRVLVDLEGHGREDIIDRVNLTRTVGWFTTIFPALLDLETAETAAQSLPLIQAQLRRTPDRGLGYGILRYLSPDESLRERFQHLPQAEILFNYLGQFDQFGAQTPASPIRMMTGGLTSNSQGRRSHVLQVSGIVIHSQLRITWEYSHDLHARSTIENLATWYMDAVRALLASGKSMRSRKSVLAKSS